MSIEEGKVIFELSRPIVYSSRSGGDVRTTTIELREPGMDHVKEYTRLKQMINQAQMGLLADLSHVNGMGEKIDEAKSKNIPGKVVNSFADEAKSIEDEHKEAVDLITSSVMSSSSVDAYVFLNTFSKMACKIGRTSVCMVDGSQAMTAALWENLNPDDALNMAFKWCGFFATALDGAEKNTSKQQPESATQPKVV